MSSSGASIGQSIFAMIIFFDRDGEALEEISSNLSFPSLGLEEEGNYSCAGVNYLGTGEFTNSIIDVIGRIISYMHHQKTYFV